ncbi:MAG: DoxX family membrane protein [Vicingus serpentipes]|nr:DoxX family membrane protein [Vicingus serpentipes]
MMKILTYISRVFVGALFIVSGLVKANDTLGFSYKLEEYFENGALAYRIRDWFGWDSFSLEFLMEDALLLAVVMCAAEIVLGFSLLFGTKIKFTVLSLLGLTVMFFFLTLHTATCDPHASYNEVTVVEQESPEHNRMLGRMENNDKVTIVGDENGKITFQEEMPVQCVTDCGCFGDAMKGSLGRSLTPWESWAKDMILMLFIIPIWLYRKRIKMNTRNEDILLLSGSLLFVLFLSWVFDWYFPALFFVVGVAGYVAMKRFIQPLKMQWMPILYTALISCVFIYYTYNHLPIRDYRAYAVGKSIPEQMVLPDGAIPDVYENLFYYKNKTTGEVEEFTETNYPWDNDNYEFADRKTKLIQKGDEPAITDFTMMADDGNDYAQDYLNEPGYLFVLVAYDINKTNKSAFSKINTFVAESNKDGNYFIGLTASLYGELESFRHEQQTMFDFFTCDAITLKTIVRANPGILLLKQGKILGKWNANDLPDYQLVKANYLN